MVSSKRDKPKMQITQWGSQNQAGDEIQLSG